MAGAWRGAIPVCDRSDSTKKASPYSVVLRDLHLQHAGARPVHAGVRQRHRLTRTSTSAPARTATRSSTTPTPKPARSATRATNSGGHLTIQNSEFNNNSLGSSATARTTMTRPRLRTVPARKQAKPGRRARTICWLFTKNTVHDNNNPNVPTTASLGAGRSGAAWCSQAITTTSSAETSIYDNGAWGILLVPYPAIEEEPPPDLKEDNCLGGAKVEIEGETACYYDDFGERRSPTTRSRTMASSATRATSTWPRSPTRRTPATAGTAT